MNLLNASADRRGAYRAKLDPAAFGFPMTRRRTVGLRREEVELPHGRWDAESDAAA